MKLSEAIEKLNSLKSEYGDIDLVWILHGNDDYDEYPEIAPVNFVVVYNPLDFSKYIVTFD